MFLLQGLALWVAFCLVSSVQAQVRLCDNQDCCSDCCALVSVANFNEQQCLVGCTASIGNECDGSFGAPADESCVVGLSLGDPLVEVADFSSVSLCCAVDSNGEGNLISGDDTAQCLLTVSPTGSPTKSPTNSPTNSPTKNPTTSPSTSPTKAPTSSPSKNPTTSPTESPTQNPTASPTESPTHSPTTNPTRNPTTSPSFAPTKNPTNSPTKNPTVSPTKNPTLSPTKNPTRAPTTSPTQNPTGSPTNNPTRSPSLSPTFNPTVSPTESPTKNPTTSPTKAPSQAPTITFAPTDNPSASPTTSPTFSPTFSPVQTSAPTVDPGVLFGLPLEVVAGGGAGIFVVLFCGVFLIARGRRKSQEKLSDSLVESGGEFPRRKPLPPKVSKKSKGLTESELERRRAKNPAYSEGEEGEDLEEGSPKKRAPPIPKGTRKRSKKPFSEEEKLNDEEQQMEAYYG